MKYLLVLSLFIVACTVKSPAVATNKPGDSLLIKPEKEMTFEEKIRLQEEIIHRQDLELKKQDRELMELQRQQIYNKATENYKKTHEVR